MKTIEPARLAGKSTEYADMLLLRFGEFTLKGKNRSRFEKTMLRHVKEIVKPYPMARLIKEYGRIYVELNGEPAGEMVEALAKVFGISSISPVRAVKPELEEIVEASLRFIERVNPEPGTTFKVNARRVWKDFPHGSQEMNRLVSAPLLKTFPALSVDVRTPMLELRVEVREQYAYIFCENIPAVGGFPLGTNGKAMLLLSGGIDSPVAAWSSMRRGWRWSASISSVIPIQAGKQGKRSSIWPGCCRGTPEESGCTWFRLLKCRPLLPESARTI